MKNPFRRSRTDRIVAVGLADEHSGHWLGALNPEAHWQMENAKGDMVDFHPQLTETQKYLWEVYEWARKGVFDLADGCPLFLLQVGDLTQGDRYGHVVSPLVDHQAIMGYYSLKPWFSYENLRAVRIILGTGAHNFKEGASERICCSLLRAEYPNLDIKAMYHGLHEIGGVTIDTAHHGPYPGSRRYLSGRVATLYLKDAMEQDLDFGNTPADIYLRAHYHTKLRVPASVEYQGQEYFSWLVELPSFCGIDDYIRKVTRSKVVQTHGLAAFVIEGKKLQEIRWFTKTLDLRTKEKLG